MKPAKDKKVAVERSTVCELNPWPEYIHVNILTNVS